MSRTKDLYFEHFATYDYVDMPNHDFELEYRIWQMKEDRLDKIYKILELFNGTPETRNEH